MEFFSCDQTIDVPHMGRRLSPLLSLRVLLLSGRRLSMFASRPLRVYALRWFCQGNRDVDEVKALLIEYWSVGSSVRWLQNIRLLALHEQRQEKV